MLDENSIQSKGGKARAEALSSEQRKEIARTAATARWAGEGILRASHDGEIKIGDTVIKAAVLPNGKRLLTQGTFLLAIGRSRTPKAGTGGVATVDGLPFFLQADQLKPFISDELSQSTTPIFFRLKDGQRAVGYDANLLPMVCEVYLKLRDQYAAEGKQPPKNYEHIILACDILMRGLARVGIVALVDEATGFQEVRDRLALQKILETFISKELAAWAKRFPDDFYKEMFRLKQWQWNGIKVHRPSVVGHYTNDLVYDRLAPGVLEELRRLNPPDEKGHRRHRHHQWLTPDVGHPKLRDHINGVLALMRASSSWDQFKRMLDRAFPKANSTMLLPFPEDVGGGAKT